MKNRAKILILAAILFLSAAVFAHKISAGTSDNLSGYAWSETIGWISFNCVNAPGQCEFTDYGVNVASNGDLSGFAWSETIGWISFNKGDTKNCPSSPCQAKLNKSQAKLEGWAKAVGADNNGWDGWIHLSGSNYGVTASGCFYGGYAWGSDVVGWIHFSGSNYGVVGTGKACTGIEADIKANGSDGPITIPVNTSAIITWCGSDAHPCSEASSCSVSPTGWSGTSGSFSTGNLASSQTYTLSCTGQGTASDSVTVNVEAPPLSVSCSVSPDEAKAGETVAWSAGASGGTGSYSFSWDGSPNPNPLDGKTGNPVYVAYTSTGVNTGTVTITSGADSQSAICLNSAGGSGINILPGIIEFTANPSKIIPGQSSTLSWDSAGFTSCSIDQSIGAVSLKGNKIVAPINTTTYTLLCLGSSDEKSVTVTVLEVPEFIEISPAEILPE